VKGKKITLIIPAMLDETFDLLKYAFDSRNVHTVVLKNTDGVVNTGLEYVNNDICYPCVIITGQLITAVRSGRLDTENCVFMTAQAGDACRGSNYISVIRKALKKAEIDIPVISLNFMDLEKNARFSVTPKMLVKALAAVMFSDILMLLKNQVLPYEVNSGETMRLYKDWQIRLKRRILRCERLDPLSLSRTFRMISDDFAKIERRQLNLKKVGIVGELYVKYCSIGNHGVGDFLASRGAEHMTNGFSWYVLYYIDTHLTELSEVNPVMAAAYGTAGKFIESVQRSMVKAIKANGFACFDSFSGFKRTAEKYIPCACPTGDGWLIGAEICNFAEIGYGRVACVQPFGCMPNHVCGRGLYSSIQRRVGNVRLVSVDYDSGSSEVNIRNRLQMLLDF
jgi:predicted nucleotide-binding protein (sugar kinase/HSP70/actin superfamily)